MSRPVAAIDLGTNTVRLLIGSLVDGEIRQTLIVRRITRLGGGFTRESGISPEAWERTLASLKEFAQHIAEHAVTRIRAVATSAVRDAVNGAAFCNKVLAETGIELEVIDGETEGLLTLKGVLAGIDGIPERLLLFDVGGGSTEYTVARGTHPLYSRSLPLGVVRLTDGKPTREAMSEKIDRELAALRDDLDGRGYLPMAYGATTIGTAGTATTLAAISLGMTDYDYRKVNNYSLALEEIEAIYNLLLSKSPAERLKVPGLEKGREDLIPAGTLLTLKTLALFGSTTLKVSDFGLLEGVLLSIS